MLASIYGDGYILGTDLAKEKLTGEVFTNWDTWKPGNSNAARLVERSKGLKDLLSRSNITIQGMTNTALNELGRALAESIADGMSRVDTARYIEDTLANPARAMLIAATETRRAVSVASMNAYQEAGIAEISWVIAENEGLCEDCSDNADASPIPLGDEFPSGDTETPAHPNCYCGIEPEVSATITPDEFDALFAQYGEE